MANQKTLSGSRAALVLISQTLEIWSTLSIRCIQMAPTLQQRNDFDAVSVGNGKTVYLLL
jgi:hypothetical protein